MTKEDSPIKLLQSYFNALEQLRGKALKARTSLINQYNYDIVHDYRISIFEQIDRLLIYHDTNVMLFFRYIMHPSYVSNLFNTSEQDSKRIAIDYLQRTKHALIVFIQSVIESFYRSLCIPLAIKAPFSFTKLVNTIFNHFNVSKDCNWYKANDILGKIRNTLHNNGIHTHADEYVCYYGKTHYFSQNSLHQSAGYETIICVIKDLIDFIYYIGAETSDIRLIDNHGFADNNRII